MLVSDFTERCSAEEFAQWIAYLSLKPEDFEAHKPVEAQLLSIFGKKKPHG